MCPVLGQNVSRISQSFAMQIFFCLAFTRPHRNQVVRHLQMLYNHYYYVLKEELKEVYRLNITLDFWANRKAESFLCVTGHWTIQLVWLYL